MTGLALTLLIGPRRVCGRPGTHALASPPPACWPWRGGARGRGGLAPLDASLLLAGRGNTGCGGAGVSRRRRSLAGSGAAQGRQGQAGEGQRGARRDSARRGFVYCCLPLPLSWARAANPPPAARRLPPTHTHAHALHCPEAQDEKHYPTGWL